MRRRYAEVDVFTHTPYRGNPLAVVLDAGGLSTDVMQRFARWTNLSETTFVLPPSTPGADYAVRIFTPVEELPFAGHPTLGSCHAWLGAGGAAARADEIVQECGAGLVRVRRTPAGLAFAAPPLRREGPVDEAIVAELAASLGVARGDVVDAEWVDNGPGWIGLLLPSAADVLAIRPAVVRRDVGVVGLHPPGAPCAIEVRAVSPVHGATVEDPVTGSLNASLAGWLLRTGRVRAPYVAAQGTAIDRAGRVHIEQDGGVLWVGGGAVTCVEGTVEL